MGHAKRRAPDRINGLVVSVIFVSMLHAQNPQRRAASFEVASVKPTVGESPFVDKVPHRSGERVFMHNSELLSMLAWAYGIKDVNHGLVAGKWEKALWETYDIDGIAPPSTNDSDLRAMFQDVFETRFHFRMHRETRQLEAYDLIVARGGVRLVVTEPGPKLTLGHGGISSWVEIGANGNRLVGRGASMNELAIVLSERMNGPVIDRTGLAGVFDYSVLFTPDLANSDTPLLTTAIQNLGLTLRKGRAEFEVVVVDNIDKLTDN